MAILNGGFPGGGGVAEEVYSTEETRIGTWIDGKPLYRRVIPITLPTGEGFVSSPISGISYVDWPVSIQGCVRAAEGSNIPISFYGSDGATTLGVQFSSGRFYAFVKSHYLFGMSGYIIFKYTKTTDPTPTSTLSAAPFTARAPSILSTTAVTAAEMGI